MLLGFREWKAFRTAIRALLLLCLLASSTHAGYIDWQKCLGGSLEDAAHSVQRTSDGGYIVAGHTNSSDGDVRGHIRGLDYWVVKLDNNGKPVWQKCLGGTSSEEARSVQQTADGGYIVAGYTKSYDGDVIAPHGGKDFWVVKLGKIDCTLTAPDHVCPKSFNTASVAESGAEYDWTIDNGKITSSNKAQSINFTAGESGAVSLKVYVKKYSKMVQSYIPH